MKLLYSREAKEAIRHLPPTAKKGIQQTLENLQQNPSQDKALQKELTGYWSVSLKRYHILYKIVEEEKKIEIYSIGSRENVYEEFVKFLSNRKL